MDKIDSTKNVLDLVAAQAVLVMSLRDSDLRLHEANRIAYNRYHDAIRLMAVERINDLLKQKTEFDNEQRNIQRLQVNELAKILSQQISENNAAIDKRLSEGERFRYEVSGKGQGANAVIGYVLAVISAGIAIAIAVLKH